MKFRSRIYAIVFLLFFAVPAFAQDAPSPEVLQERLVLARQLHVLLPVQDQVDGAISAFVARLPLDRREQERMRLEEILNAKALEQISVDAYAEIYTAEELQAMINYYSKPEAQTAARKTRLYNERLSKAIMRMLDQALMRKKVEGAP